MTMRSYEERKEPVSFDDVTVVRETDNAILCEFPDGNEEWIPKSQIHDDSEVYKFGTDGTLIIPRWLAQAKGLPCD
jgi:hypothetical protein